MGIRNAHLIWYPRNVQRRVQAVIFRKLKIVGEMLRAAVVKNISIPTRTQGPSSPGEFPHADTGRLKQDIYYRVDEDNMMVEIGTTLDYGYWLETGTRKMAARPFLVPTYMQMQGNIQRVFRG